MILLWQGIQYPNNSVLNIEAVGEGERSLICRTDKRPCCRSLYYNRVGEWYYPDGHKVPIERIGETFYRNRNDEGEVRLNQRAGDHYTTYPNAIGVFCCVLPDANDMNHTLCIGLLPRDGVGGTY